MRYAIVDGSDVINVIEWNGEEEYEAPEGMLVLSAPEEVSVGWKVSSDGWVPPVSPPPEPDPVPYEDPVVLAAKNSALAELVALGITESTARTIVGLPPA
jgi:hypothetical protein